MGEESGAGTAGVQSIKRQERRTKAALIYLSLASAEPGATAAPPDELTWIYVSTVANDYFAYTLTQRGTGQRLPARSCSHASSHDQIVANL